MLRTFRRVDLDDEVAKKRSSIKDDPGEQMENLAQCYDRLAKLSSGPSLAVGPDTVSCLQEKVASSKKKTSKTSRRNQEQEREDSICRRERFSETRSYSARQQSSRSVNTTGSGKSTKGPTRGNVGRSKSDDGMRPARRPSLASSGRSKLSARGNSRRNLSSTASLDIEALSQKSLQSAKASSRLSGDQGLSSSLHDYRRPSLMSRKGSASSLTASNHSATQSQSGASESRRPSLAPEIAKSLGRKRSISQGPTARDSGRSLFSTPSLTPSARDPGNHTSASSRDYESDTGAITKQRQAPSGDKTSLFDVDPFGNDSSQIKDTDGSRSSNPFGSNPFKTKSKENDGPRGFKIAALATSFKNKVQSKIGQSKSNSKDSETTQVTCSEDSDDDDDSENGRKMNSAKSRWSALKVAPGQYSLSALKQVLKMKSSKQSGIGGNDEADKEDIDEVSVSSKEQRRNRHRDEETATSRKTTRRHQGRKSDDESVVSKRSRRPRSSRRSDDESVVSSMSRRHRSSRHSDDKSVVSTRSRRYRSRHSDDESVVSRRSRRSRDRDDASVVSRSRRSRDDASVVSRRRGRRHRDDDGGSVASFRSYQLPSRSGSSSRGFAQRRKKEDDDEASCFDWEKMEFTDDKFGDDDDSRSLSGYRGRSRSTQPVRPRRTAY